MRLEGHRKRRLAVRLAHLHGGLDHGAVTEMDAVEIAERHHRSLRERGRRGVVADNGKASGHFRWDSSGILKAQACGEDGDVAAPSKSSGRNRTKTNAIRKGPVNGLFNA